MSENFLVVNQPQSNRTNITAIRENLLPPNDIGAEEAILAALFLDQDSKGYHCLFQNSADCSKRCQEGCCCINSNLMMLNLTDADFMIPNQSNSYPSSSTVVTVIASPVLLVAPVLPVLPCTVLLS